MPPRYALQTFLINRWSNPNLLHAPFSSRYSMNRIYFISRLETWFLRKSDRRGGEEKGFNATTYYIYMTYVALKQSFYSRDAFPRGNYVNYAAATYPETLISPIRERTFGSLGSNEWLIIECAVQSRHEHVYSASHFPTSTLYIRNTRLSGISSIIRLNDFGGNSHLVFSVTRPCLILTFCLGTHTHTHAHTLVSMHTAR